MKKTQFLRATFHNSNNIFITKGFQNILINLLLDTGILSCFNPLFRLFLPLKQQITGRLVYGSCIALKNTIFQCPEPSITQKNTVKKQDFSYKKMPENCRLSFCPNLILTQQTSIFIIKFEHFRAYLELCKKIAMLGNPAGTCRLWVVKIFRVAWRIRKGPDPKIFGVIWERVLAPFQATQEIF